MPAIGPWLRFVKICPAVLGAFLVLAGLVLTVLACGRRAQDMGVVKPVLAEFGSCSPISRPDLPPLA